MNILGKEQTKGLDIFVGRFALPVLIFSSLAKLDFGQVMNSISSYRGLSFKAFLTRVRGITCSASARHEKVMVGRSTVVLIHDTRCSALLLIARIRCSVQTAIQVVHTDTMSDARH